MSLEFLPELLLGTLSINDGADHQQGLGSVTIGSAVGSLGNQQTYEISGNSMGSSVGSPQVDDTVNFKS